MDNKLYHPKKGEITVVGKRYKRLGNRSVTIGRDEDGKEYELDGTELPLEALDMELKDQETAHLRKTNDTVENSLDEEEKDAQNEDRETKHTEVLEAVKHAPDAIVEAVGEAGEDIVEAIKSIPETVIPEYPQPIDHTAKLEEVKEAIVQAIKGTEDRTDEVVSAVKGIKIPETKIPQPKDYSSLLKGIKDALPKDTDLSKVEELLLSIATRPDFQLPQSIFNENGRIKVEVDRIGMGGGGATGMVTDSSGSQINPATEETLQSITAKYAAQVKPDSLDPNVYYVGLAPVGSLTSEAVWQMRKLDKTEGVTVLWADGNTDFDNVFDNRESIIYS